MPNVAATTVAEKIVTQDPGDLFTWPIITDEDEAVVLRVLRSGKMSGIDVTQQFEAEIAAWHGTRFALGHNNGTAALHAAMWACGVQRGDEIIGPSVIYWASVLPAFNLGATVNFADIDPVSLCIDPNDIERRIGPRTKAIVAVHYFGHPCDMDPILAIARRHNIKVIEDVSHAHGSRYKGKLCGTLGDAAAMSLMSGKSLAAGEAGMLLTSDATIYERAIAFGHYERTGGTTRFTKQSAQLSSADLRPFAGVPMGGFKYRMHQLSAALGRVQLKHYSARIIEIQKSMNQFWNLLDNVPGIRPHRCDYARGDTMGGWYAPHGLYVPEELGGLTVTDFCREVTAAGADCMPGANKPLHLHPLFHDADIYGDGRPTALAHAYRDVRQNAGSLPHSEALQQRCFSIPWFKHHRPEIIATYATAFKTVALRHAR
jgi:perosamine synthetase